MSRLVRATRNLEWIAERTGGSYSTKARAIEAVDGDRTVGMVAYDSFTRNLAQVSIALEEPHAWWSLARPAFAYPFEELNLGILIALVSSRNTRSMRLTGGVGFEEAHRFIDGITPGVDLVVFEMRREKWRANGSHSESAR